MKQGKYFTVICCCLLLTGCAQQLIHDTDSPTSRREASKNYVVGKERSAYVGDAMVRVKDYLVTVSASPVAIPSENVTIGDSSVSARLEKGHRYPIVGNIIVDGMTLAVVEVVANTGLKGGVLFDSSGKISNRAVVGQSGRYILALSTMTVTPPTARMIRGQDEKVDTRAGYTNFELVYSGKSGNSLNILYREYTPDDLARSAFFQSLTYDVTTRVVRFKALKIEIKEANNEGVTYTVVDDGG